MDEKQLDALTNTIYFYETGQLDLTDDQTRDLKAMADAVGIPFNPDFSARRAALGLINNIAFGIPGGVAGVFGSEAFDPINPYEETAAGLGTLISFFLGGGIAKKLLGGVVGRGLASKASRDAAVRAAAGLRSTGLPGTGAAARAIAARGPGVQNVITSGLGYGSVGGLQGLFDPEGSLLGGFTEGATFGALAPVGARLLARGRGAGKAATTAAESQKAASSGLMTSAAEKERALKVAEQLRMQEAMENLPRARMLASSNMGAAYKERQRQLLEQLRRRAAARQQAEGQTTLQFQDPNAGLRVRRRRPRLPVDPLPPPPAPFY